MTIGIPKSWTNLHTYSMILYYSIYFSYPIATFGPAVTIMTCSLDPYLNLRDTSFFCVFALFIAGIIRDLSRHFFYISNIEKVYFKYRKSVSTNIICKLQNLSFHYVFFSLLINVLLVIFHALLSLGITICEIDPKFPCSLPSVCFYFMT